MKHVKMTSLVVPGALTAALASTAVTTDAAAKKGGKQATERCFGVAKAGANDCAAAACYLGPLWSLRDPAAPSFPDPGAKGRKRSAVRVPKARAAPN